MNWQRLASVEAVAFNLTMMAHGVRAYIDITTPESASSAIKIFPEAVIIYTIDIEPGQSFSKVFSLKDEVTAAIARARIKYRFSIKDLSIRFDNNPLPTLEVDTPPGFRVVPNKLISEPYTSIIGTSYSVLGREWFKFDLTKHHQTLVAAMSGHGKSVLLKRISTGLMSSTLPSAVSLYVIDFKNDDLVFTNERSHTKMFAFDESGAEAIIERLTLEKESRKAANSWSSRKILLIDELAELPKRFDEPVASLMKMGRSMGINVIAATQHPTAKQIGEQIARSFTHRFVGRVESSNAARWATGIEGSGAELLKKPGSFLYCFGGDSTRLQVFGE